MFQTTLAYETEVGYPVWGKGLKILTLILFPSFVTKTKVQFLPATTYS